MTDARELARQQWDVRCALCGNPGHQHNSVTRACPVGRKSRTFGYSSFHSTNRFTDSRTRGVALPSLPPLPEPNCREGEPLPSPEGGFWMDLYDAEQMREYALAALAAYGVASVDADRVQRLRDAIEGECDGLAIDEHHARAILQYVDGVSVPDSQPKE